MGLLKGVASLLRPGGQLFIDLENPLLLTEVVYSTEPVFETSFIDEVTNRRVEQWSQSSLDTKTQTLSVTWQFRTQIEGSESPMVQMIYHYLYPHQIVLLLQQAGFRLEKMIGDYKGESFQEESERLILLASLPG